MVKCAKDYALQGMVEIGILIDDHRRIAAQLQNDRLLACLCFQSPANAGRASKGEQFQPLILSEQIRSVTASRQDRKSALWQNIALGQNLAHNDRAQRCLGSWLHDKGTAHRNRGRNLVCSQIKRKVEGRNKTARPDRHTLPHAHIALGARRNIKRLDLAIIAGRFLCCDLERVDQSVNLALGILDRLARLDTQ